MGCEVCEQAFSGLVLGIISLVTFILMPILQLLAAAVKFALEILVDFRKSK